MTRMPSPIAIRRANRGDAPALGRLGGLLLRQHHGFDARRFIPPGDDPEGGYAWFLGRQLERDDGVVLVAERDGAVVGYAWAGIEPRSWKELRDECAFLHDIVVDAEARGHGVARALIDAVVAWSRARDMPRLMLWTAEANAPAQRLFAARGFRLTMREMTLELDEGSVGQEAGPHGRPGPATS
jgi:GNAT superfamily N-acetyltransferase